jgi:hypothetical protein
MKRSSMRVPDLGVTNAIKATKQKEGLIIIRISMMGDLNIAVLNVERDSIINQSTIHT